MNLQKVGSESQIQLQVCMTLWEEAGSPGENPHRSRWKHVHAAANAEPSCKSSDGKQHSTSLTPNPLKSQSSAL